MNTASRFSRISRRAFVSGSASLSAIVGLSACSNDANLSSGNASSAPTSAGAGAGQSSAAPSQPAATSNGGSTAAGGILTVDFTIESPTSGGPARNPYIAIWVETAGGEYVQTIALWHLQGEKDRWLSELRDWYSATGGTETNSGATRNAGSYSVAWDLLDAQGNAVPAGTYTLNIEGAREHGNYQLLSTKISIGGAESSGDFTAKNDITAASWRYLP